MTLGPLSAPRYRFCFCCNSHHQQLRTVACCCQAERPIDTVSKVPGTGRSIVSPCPATLRPAEEVGRHLRRRRIGRHRGGVDLARLAGAGDDEEVAAEAEAPEVVPDRHPPFEVVVVAVAVEEGGGADHEVEVGAGVPRLA